MNFQDHDCDTKLEIVGNIDDLDISMLEKYDEQFKDANEDTSLAIIEALNDYDLSLGDYNNIGHLIFE